MAFIEAHSQEALRTRGFLELSATALLPVLRSDKLCVDEAELVQAARNWARVGAVSGTWGTGRTPRRRGPQELCKRAARHVFKARFHRRCWSNPWPSWQLQWFES